MISLFIDSLSLYSFASAGVIFFGYIVQSSALQFWFYFLSNSSRSRQWKIQEEKGVGGLGIFWTVPFLSEGKLNRANDHALLTTLNLITASFFAFVVTELCIWGKSRMSFQSAEEYGFTTIVRDLLIAVTFENITEYYWHRFLHSKLMYKRFHKFHHFVKSPEPWDDMYIHPFEAVAYYTILYSPPFLFQCHHYSFLLYMIIMGLCGTLDHSGVKINIPGDSCYQPIFLSSVQLSYLNVSLNKISFLRLVFCNQS